MFEIGSTLRDARVRKGISLQKVEEDTKIRVKYIQAMENEDFDVLPGGTYVKGFLRTYAEYLGLDYQVILDEYNDRFGSGEQHEHVIQPPRTAKPKSPHKRQNFLLVAILAVAIIAVLAYLGWGNSSSQMPSLVATTGMETAGQTVTTPAAIAQPQPEAAPRTQTQTQTQADVFESIVFQASTSRNWVGVYKDSGLREPIWSETLSPGETKILDRTTLGSLTQIWLKVGSVEGLTLKINGKVQELTGQTTYKVTPAGLTVVPG